MLKTYLKRVFEIADRGDDRKESYYSTLEKLLEGYANSTHKPHIKLTTLPKKTEAGNPDFPRVPFTGEYKTFSKMTEHGASLVELHLMRSKDFESPLARFSGNGENKVERAIYAGSRVGINDSQYFEQVEPEVWEYQIGGYKVCDKWLKDRKGRGLPLDDVKHYCKIMTALGKTNSVQ